MRIFKAITIIMGIFLISVLAIVSAAKDDVANATNTTSEKNMTYGQCVSAAAEVKNTCYDTVKADKEACRDAAVNMTDAKAADKTCKADYKKDMKECKVEFKKAKNECKKIKHTAFETMASSMK